MADAGGGSGLTTEQAKVFGQALTQLRSGVSQSKLYALETAQAQRVIKNVHDALAKLMDSVGAVSLIISKGNPFLNGSQVDIDVAGKHVAGQIVELEEVLNDAGLPGLSIDPALQTEELGQFLHALARKQLGSTNPAEINSLLQQKGVNNITVLAGDGSGGQSGGGFSAEGGAVGGIEAAVQFIADTLEGVDHEVSRSQLRARAAEGLVEKDLELVREVFVASARGMGTDQARAAGLPFWCADPARDANCIKTLGLLWQTIGTTDAGQAAHESIASLMYQIMEPYRQRPESWAQLTSVLDASMVNLVPPWIHEILPVGPEAGFEARFARVLKIPPDYLLSPDEYAEAVAILDGLFQQQGLDAFKQVIGHLIQAMQNPVAGTRALAVQRVMELAERYQAGLGGWTLEEHLETVLLEFAAHETNTEVYERMLAYVAGKVTVNFQSGRAARGRACFERLNAFCGNGNTILPDASEVANGKLRELRADAFVSLLVNDVIQHPEHQDDALAVLQALGDSALPAMLAGIKQCPDVQRVKELIQMMVAKGGGFAEALLKELGSEENPEVVVRLLEGCEVLRDDEALWACLPVLLAHASQDVRDRTLDFCGLECDERIFPELEKAVEEMTEEEQVARLVEMIEIMNDIRCGPIIRSLLAREGEAVLSEQLGMTLIRTLARFATPEIIPFMEPLFQSPDPARKKQRVRAMESLGAMFQDEATIAALKPLQQDKEPEVARTAAGVLAGLARNAKLDSPPPRRTAAPAAPQAAPEPAPSVAGPTAAPAAPPAAATAPAPTAAPAPPAAPARPAAPGAPAKRPAKNPFNPFDPFAAPKSDRPTRTVPKKPPPANPPG